MALRLNTSEKSEIVDIRRFCFAFWDLPSEVTLAFVHSAWVSVFSAGFGNLLDIPYCHGSTIRSRATLYPFSEVPFEILLSSEQ